MIITVTLNPALDKSIVIPGFTVNTVNRTQQTQLDPGGKGINVSKTVHALGGETLAMGILGGASGGYIKSVLDRMEVPNAFTLCGNATRTNLKIHDPILGTTTDINEAGTPAEPAVLEQVWETLNETAKPGDLVLFAGKNPPETEDELLAQWVKALRSRGVYTAVDTVGRPMELALQQCPEIIKPNLDELSQLLGRPAATPQEAAAAALSFVKDGVRLAVVSMGGKGAVFASKDGVVYGRAPKVQVSGTTGAGDAMMAALCCCFLGGDTLEQTARCALAVSAAAVMQLGTKPIRPQMVQPLLEQVVLESV